MLETKKMTFLNSLLLGSATAIVAVAGARAADLPTRKASPAAQYVKICAITAAGAPITGFALPGSDTCFKISGYVTGQIEGGNLKTGYTYAYDGLPQVATGPSARDSFGFTTRYNLAVDVASNTAMGPLLGHAEFQFDHGEGFDNTGQGGSDGGLNRAYVSWAGITAGKANSFYSFTAAGPAWANFLSPDRQGFNQPDLLAYTVPFASDFAATISAESAWANPTAGSGGSSVYDLPGFTNGGARVPDIVGNLTVTKSWGSAGLSGVAHEVRTVATADGATQDKWGYGVAGGVKVNLPTFGEGDDVYLIGAYARNAIYYSGMAPGEMMWGEGGAVNGNGQQLALADTFYEGLGRWATPTAWSVSAYLEHHFTPEFSLSPLFSYGEVAWTGDPTGVLTDGRTYIAGGVAHYAPVTNLDFEFEVLYQNSQSDRPAALAIGTPWFGDADGFASRFEITRSF
jgi:hypothetical protein